MVIDIKIKSNVTEKSLKEAAKEIIEKKKVDLDCECGHKITETIGRLQKNPKVTCPSCGRGITVTME